MMRWSTHSSFMNCLYRWGILIICSWMLTIQGCSSIDKKERNAHFINGQRYIPLLKEYINKDETILPPLKETYGLALDEWWNLIQSKNAE